LLILEFNRKRVDILSGSSRVEGYPDLINIVNDFFGKRISKRPRSKKQFYKILFAGEANLMKRICAEIYFSREMSTDPNIDPENIKEIIKGYSSKKKKPSRVKSISNEVGIYKTDYGDVLMNSDIANEMELQECERSKMSVTHRMLIDIF